MSGESAESQAQWTDSESRLIADIEERVRARLSARRPLAATYRLQFTRDQFRFENATAIVGYLADLGVSHVYASPCTTAHSGSTHGYDVIDHSRINPELGGCQGFDALAAALHQRGLGILLDIVPNHMSVAGDQNAWWMDVLMNGPGSAYASYFDIDWSPVKPELAGRVLLPVLGDLYGNVLEAGQIQIVYQEGRFAIALGESKLPLDPRTWIPLLSNGIEELKSSLGTESPSMLELDSIISSLQHLPARSEIGAEQVAHRHRERLVIERRLQQLVEASGDVAKHVQANLVRINGAGGQPESFDELDALLEQQAFRLAYWKAGSDEMNYRRFFDVTELAAVCTENPAVFDAIHGLVLDLAARGQVDGFRIDHIDGLLDPAEYLWRLQRAFVRQLGRCELKSAGGSMENADCSRVESIVDEAIGKIAVQEKPRPLFVLVEKILGTDEPLPVEWPAAGTSGYDALNLINGLFVDPKGLTAIERHYSRFTDLSTDLEETVYESKRLILSTVMQSEVHLLAHRLDRLSFRHRKSRDYTQQALRFAIREIVASFPVYRTYIREGFVSDRDRRVVNRAVGLARRRNPAAEGSVFGFVKDVLLMEAPPGLDEEGRQERGLFVGRFQQVTSPVMAKGVEDTAFYRHIAVTSLSEVGGEPKRAATSVEEFHRQTLARVRDWPRSMIATTTHDTKRTEDVRARLMVISEIPAEWRKALSRWTRWNRKFRSEVDGLPAPSRNDEWLFYQSLLGIWPLSPPNAEERRELIRRLQGYMEKGIREAKLRTSWISPNTAYDEAVQGFVSKVLEDPDSRFAADFQAFADSIIASGLWNSLSQTLLKLTSPGSPDIYQGQELWDFSLVDPDNRRPVDYDQRKWLLAEVVAQCQSDSGRLQLAQHLAAHPRDQRTKLFVTWTVLQARRNSPWSIGVPQYVPLEVEGEFRRHVCAFAVGDAADDDRHHAIVVCPVLIHRMAAHFGGGPDWRDTTVKLEPRFNGVYRNSLTTERLEIRDGQLSVGAALATFPVALLSQDSFSATGFVGRPH
jgi:(1->4)-alpha-D-glucan 1-alpha-D-glucosylmutase